MRIDVDSLSHDGRGVARIDGKVAFVAGALPGEAVDARLSRRHRRFDEYRLVQVLDSAAVRVDPPCPLVGTCGGCDLQHLAADAQIRHKTDVVLDLIRRQAGLVPGEVEPPLRSAPFGYRRRARLAVFHPRRRGRPVVGFREAGGNRVVAVAECPVLVDELRALPGVLQTLLGELDDPRCVGHLELSLAECSDGANRPVIHVRTVATPGPSDLARLTSLGPARDAYVSLAAGHASVRYLHQPRPEPPCYRLPEFDLRIGYQPGDFLQGNAQVNRRLVERVVQWLAPRPGQSLLDAFAGVGNFTLALARRGADVLGLEGAAAMVARARANAGDNGLDQAGFDVHDLQGVDLSAGRASSGFDGAVLDPPRTGAQRLVAGLAGRGVSPLVYVSCSPATLARDAAVLAAAGYRLSRLSVVDMFPQTSHIEVMARFDR